MSREKTKCITSFKKSRRGSFIFLLKRREENEKKNEIAIRMDVGFICWSFIRQDYLGEDRKENQR